MEQFFELKTGLNDILDHSPTIIYIQNLDRQYLMVNSQWEKVMGRKKSDIVGKTAREIFNEETFQTLEISNKKVLEQGGPLESEEVLQTASGEKVFLTNRFLLLNDKGRPYAICGTAIDITDRKKAENQLRQAINTREEVLALVSHDLRNPLNVVMMCAELLERKDSSDRTFILKQAKKIKQSSQQMVTLIEDLLNLSKMDAGTFNLENISQCGSEIVDEAIEMMQPIADGKNIKLITDIEQSSFRFNCDRNQLLRVFTNLLSNAIKFSPEEGEIILGIRRQENNQIRFFVKDFGPGISEEQKKKVFLRFWQDKKNATKGTGLGLAISQGIIESHGGKIGVDSPPHSGCTFYFDLPIVKN